MATNANQPAFMLAQNVHDSDSSGYNSGKERKNSELGDTIHSGHFMVSHVHDDCVSDDEESDEQLPGAANFSSGVHTAGKLAGSENDVTSAKSTSTPSSGGVSGLMAHVEIAPSPPENVPDVPENVPIDASLTKLFDCMTLAYRKITSPKWKNFKGMRLRLKDKVRLNNIIWREWHLQYRFSRRPLICHFAVPAFEEHSKPEACVLEGKYWKRQLHVCCSEYKKWRSFYHAKISLNAQLGQLPRDETDMELLSRLDVTRIPRVPSSTATFTALAHMDDSSFDFAAAADLMDWISDDTLFSSLTPPVHFPDPQDLRATLTSIGNADFFQPSLFSMQPTPDLSMDLDDPELLASVGFLPSEKLRDRSVTTPPASISRFSMMPTLSDRRTADGSQNSRSAGNNRNALESTSGQVRVRFGSIESLPHYQPDNLPSERVQISNEISVCNQMPINSNIQPRGSASQYSYPPTAETARSASITRVADTKQSNEAVIGPQNSVLSTSKMQSSPADIPRKRNKSCPSGYSPTNMGPDDGSDTATPTSGSIPDPEWNATAAATVESTRPAVQFQLEANTQPQQPQRFATAGLTSPTVRSSDFLRDGGAALTVQTSTSPLSQEIIQAAAAQASATDAKTAKEILKAHEATDFERLVRKHPPKVISTPPTQTSVSNTKSPLKQLIQPSSQRSTQPAQQITLQLSQSVPAPSAATQELHDLLNRYRPIKPSSEIKTEPGRSSFVSPTSGYKGVNVQQSFQPVTQIVQPQNRVNIGSPSYELVVDQQASNLPAAVPPPPVKIRPFTTLLTGNPKTTTGSDSSTFVLISNSSGTERSSSTGQFLQPAVPTGPTHEFPSFQYQSGSNASSLTSLSSGSSSSSLQPNKFSVDSMLIGNSAVLTSPPGGQPASVVNTRIARLIGNTPEAVDSVTPTPGVFGEMESGSSAETMPEKTRRRSDPKNTTHPYIRQQPTGSLTLATNASSAASSPFASQTTPPTSTTPYNSKRINHVLGEQRRRRCLNSGFEHLLSVMPKTQEGSSSIIGGGRAKTSQLQILRKACEHVQQKNRLREQILSEIDQTKKEVQRLECSVRIHQSRLPAGGLTAFPLHSPQQLKQYFNDHLNSRIKADWKYYIFSLIVRPLFQSFSSKVQTTDQDAFCKSILEWLESDCSLKNLRPLASKALISLSTDTQIMSDPNRLPYDIASILHKEKTFGT